MTKSNAQIFTELTGGCWHENTERDPLYKNNKLLCTKCNTWQLTDHSIRRGFIRPQYSNAADILNRLREFVGEEKFREFQELISEELSPYVKVIDKHYIDNPSALLERACEFLEAGK